MFLFALKIVINGFFKIKIAIHFYYHFAGNYGALEKGRSSSRKGCFISVYFDGLEFWKFIAKLCDLYLR